jgi:hypothetical protein
MAKKILASVNRKKDKFYYVDGNGNVVEMDRPKRKPRARRLGRQSEAHRKMLREAPLGGRR